MIILDYYIFIVKEFNMLQQTNWNIGCMAELKKVTGNKVIAFYLPQFHRIPENDKWWGEGFTEWTNTRKAKPLFEGHYQPKTPLGEVFYDLNDVSVMEKQAELAKKFGVFGFCYYHYWFKNGKKLLQKPIENMLRDSNVDIPFCICWANENWTRNWDGGDYEIIEKQEYGGKKEWINHFNYLLGFFKDKRYILYNGSPLIVIYKPEQIVFFDEMISCWRKLAKKNGFPGLVVLRQNPGIMLKSLDCAIKFQPAMVWNDFDYELNPKKQLRYNIIKLIKKMLILSGNEQLLQRLIVKALANSKKRNRFLRIYYYDDTWDIILNKQLYSEKLCNGAFTAWDNTARTKYGQLFLGSNPIDFEKYMKELLSKPSAMDCVFINAWNEWGEGAYLEPDEKYGYAYLEALKRALNNLNNK